MSVTAMSACSSTFRVPPDVKTADAAAADRALTLGAADVVVLPGAGASAAVGAYELRFDPTRPDAELADLAPAAIAAVPKQLSTRRRPSRPFS